MRKSLQILLWPVAAGFRLGLEVLIWFKPSIARGRVIFPEAIRKLIESATSVEVHYAESGSGETMGFTSLGMVRLESPRDRRRVIRSVIQANRECLGGFLCLDAEYGLRFESELGGVELAICFRCQQVWVQAEVEGAGRYYPISGRPQLLLDSLLRSVDIPPSAQR